MRLTTRPSDRSVRDPGRRWSPAAGSARTTTSRGAAVPASSAATRWRSRRLTRLRTTAPPTALETTKPDPAAATRHPSRRAPPASDVPRGPRTGSRGGSRPTRADAPFEEAPGLERECSGGELGATLAAAGGQDRATGAGPHPQPEAVGAAAAPVARLEGALAHGRTPQVFDLEVGRPLEDPARRRRGHGRKCRWSQRLPNGTGGSQTRQTDGRTGAEGRPARVQPTRRKAADWLLPQGCIGEFAGC